MTDAAPIRKVFISYSAKVCTAPCERNPKCPHGQCVRETTETSFLNQLIAQLKAAAIEVLSDRDQLYPGVDWKNQLYPAFASCHASIILLTQSALTSIYVPLEAMVLTWRRLLNPDFAVIPVYFEGVNEKLLKEKDSGFYGIGLEEIEAFRYNGNNGDELLQQIVTRVRGVPLATPLKDLAALRRLGALVDKVGAATIEAAATELEDRKTLDWDPLLPKPLQLAAILLQRPLGDVLYCAAVVCRALAPHERQQVFDLLVPRWVSPQAAQPVWKAGRGSVPKSVLVLNATMPQTIEHYVLRAWSHDWLSGWPILSSTGISGTIDGSDLISDMLRDYAKRIIPSQPWNEQLEQKMRAVLRQRADKGQPVYVSLKQAEGVTLDTARQLQSVDGIVVLYLADLPDTLAAPDVIVLKPRLTQEAEDQASTNTFHAISMLIDLR